MLSRMVVSDRKDSIFIARNFGHTLHYNHVGSITCNQLKRFIQLLYWNCLVSGHISRQIYKILKCEFAKS